MSWADGGRTETWILGTPDHVETCYRVEVTANNKVLVSEDEAEREFKAGAGFLGYHGMLDQMRLAEIPYIRVADRLLSAGYTYVQPELVPGYFEDEPAEPRRRARRTGVIHDRVGYPLNHQLVPATVWQCGHAHRSLSTALHCAQKELQEWRNR